MPRPNFEEMMPICQLLCHSLPWFPEAVATRGLPPWVQHFSTADCREGKLPLLPLNSVTMVHQCLSVWKEIRGVSENGLLRLLHDRRHYGGCQVERGCESSPWSAVLVMVTLMWLPPCACRHAGLDLMRALV